jgi:hypothetical protein
MFPIPFLALPALMQSEQQSVPGVKGRSTSFHLLESLAQSFEASERNLQMWGAVRQLCELWLEQNPSDTAALIAEVAWDSLGRSEFHPLLRPGAFHFRSSYLGKSS